MVAAPQGRAAARDSDPEPTRARASRWSRSSRTERGTSNACRRASCVLLLLLVATPRETTFAADLGHVGSVLGDDFAADPARLTGLVGRELVSASLGVGSFAALARDGPLLGRIHRSEAASALFVVLGHRRGS